MQLRKARRKFGAEMNMTPMIDIVFQLVIFFMLVSQVSRVEAGDVTLPEAVKGEDPETVPTGRVVINVMKDSQYFVSGRTRSLATLDAILAREVEARPPSEVTVLVRGDRDVPWEAVRQVLGVCAAKGIARVRVAVVQPGAAGS